MDSGTVHRELLLPSPTKDPPDILPLVWASPTPFWLEIHRETVGRVRYSLGSNSASDLEAMLAYLESMRPRLTGGAPIECSAATLVPEGVFARAVPVQQHHHLPIQIQPKVDSASFLLRTLGSRALRDHDVLLQLLFRRLRGWESTLFSPLYDNVAQRQHHPLRFAMHARRAEAAYHVELRAHITGPEPEEALTALGAWLEQWTTTGGVPWRRWKVIRPKAEWGFHATLANHDLRRFSSRKARRNVSSTELAHLLSIPWAAHHPECSYAGAPRGQPGPELVVRPSASPDSRAAERLVVGVSGSHRVALPREWNHVAILGRTQSGKSTLALNLVLQTLRKHPNSTVVVIEPTGTLVDGIVARLPREVASETVEIDPAHGTFQRGDATMVSVPLSLLLPPDRADELPSVRDRWSEALAGDLLAAIRSAWGEESIGGRAEFVLRALVQGLALTPGSNLVDAYHILTSKPALQRFVKTAPEGPLRDFLEHQLPRLDYTFTMSSLDKVGKVATNSLLRVALCQRDHAVSFDRLLGHRLLLLNLSKAAIGADGANFLGAIYLTQLWAAVQRSGRPDRPVYLVLDEVHNYTVPALADMLSEGAKFGLHVVAITQYLHRVPPRVRAALLGNVDVWLLFSLGTEDMDDAWRIVNGETHGWLPQDLVDGLRPYEVAMSVSGDLLKLSTRPSPRPDPQANDLRDVVTTSSRRYAQPEDSEASPWLVGQETVEGLLKALSTQPRNREELATDTALSGSRLDGVVAWSVAARDVEKDAADGKFHLTRRGSFHLQALEARRNEGEDHCAMLADTATILDAAGIPIRIVPQAGGYLLPDAEFEWRGRTYSVEVESTTLTSRFDQVVRNIRKAFSIHRRCLVVVEDRESAALFARMLAKGIPEAELWGDLGLAWRAGIESMIPYVAGPRKPWGFLTGRIDEEDEPEATSTDEETLRTKAIVSAADDPLATDLTRVYECAERLRATGNIEVTATDFKELTESDNGNSLSLRRLGMALSSLGVRSQRVMRDGVQVRVYDLRTLLQGAGPRRAYPGDPAGRDPNDASGET
ncbi:MAG: type IV secretory system conjugative DNA transfer family protein [Thermoplasmata archaeon]